MDAGAVAPAPEPWSHAETMDLIRIRKELLNFQGTPKALYFEISRRMFQLNHNRSPAECLAKMDELLRQYELSVSKGKHVAGQPLINNLAPLHERLTYAAANATAAPTAHGLVLRGDSDDAAEAARNRKRRRSESDDDVLTQLVSYMKQDQAAAVAREEHLRAQIRDANSLRDFLLTVLSQVTSALVSLPQNKAVLGSLPPEAAQFLREGINLEAQSSGHLVSPMTQAQVVSRARDAVQQVQVVPRARDAVPQAQEQARDAVPQAQARDGQPPLWFNEYN